MIYGLFGLTMVEIGNCLSVIVSTAVVGIDTLVLILCIIKD